MMLVASGDTGGQCVAPCTRELHDGCAARAPGDGRGRAGAGRTRAPGNRRRARARRHARAAGWRRALASERRCNSAWRRDSSAAAIATGRGAVGSPEWARVPDVDGCRRRISDPAGRDWLCTWTAGRDCRRPLGLLLVDGLTSSWTRRTLAAIALLVVIGIAISGAPAGLEARGWVYGGVLTAAGLLFAYVTLLRHDLTMVPVALAIMGAVGALARAAGRAYPGALPGSLIAAVLLLLVGWWWFGALRRGRAEAAAPGAPVAG